MKLTMKMLGLMAALCLVLNAGATSGDDAKSDLATLKGTWVRELDGKTFILLFNGENYALINEFTPERATATGTVTIDPTKKPRRIDIKVADGTGTGAKHKGKTARCIYQLDGDTLRFCSNRPGLEGYPEQFPDKEGGDKYFYFVFKRAK
jgi:uncharacterized protein (TIGR03067 family)